MTTSLSSKTQMYLGLGVLGAVGVLFLLRRKPSAPTTPGKAPGPGPSPAPIPARNLYTKEQYPPLSPDAVALFTSAAKYAGLPVEWASSVELSNIMSKESNGWVGRPNYQFGEGSSASERATWLMNHRERWPLIWDSIRRGTWRDMLAEPYRSKPAGEQSSATGLGQLTWSNIRTGNFYPSGVEGIGNAFEEAIGMLRYIKQRYGSPQAAWAQYGKGHEGY